MERIKITIEFIMRASPALLYRYFTSPSDIIRWFCDEADISMGVYTFEWDGYGEEARLTENIEDELVRYDWLDPDRAGEYLEFKISKSGMTNETVLIITDYCDDDEEEGHKQLWRKQIDQLRKATGLG
ncbi:MAG TPA: SRPBCC domain-containing protein [Bacteroidetes bacterium]|nr:SRPBCC domain-containing protein [Bacteroidota bacterium]